MIRDLSAGILSELDSRTIAWTILAELQFADGTVRVWTGPQGAALDYDGETWSGTGDLGSIDKIAETEEISDTRLRGVLRTSTANLDSVELADNEGRTATFIILLFNRTTGAALGDIRATFEMGAAWVEPRELKETGARIIQNDLVMEFVGEGGLLDRRHVRRMTHEETLEIDPNDYFNQFASDPDLARAEDQVRMRTAEEQTRFTNERAISSWEYASRQ